MNDIENPFRPPSSLEMRSGDSEQGRISSRVVRYAILGALVGMGFGFVVLAMATRIAVERRSIDEAYFEIDYVTPLFAFGFWSITLGSFFSVVGGTIGFVAERLSRLRK